MDEKLGGWGLIAGLIPAMFLLSRMSKEQIMDLKSLDGMAFGRTGLQVRVATKGQAEKHAAEIAEIETKIAKEREEREKDKRPANEQSAAALAQIATGAYRSDRDYEVHLQRLRQKIEILDLIRRNVDPESRYVFGVEGLLLLGF